MKPSPRRGPRRRRFSLPLALPLAALLVAGLGACQRTAPPPAPEVVAEVAGEEVRWNEFQSYVETALGSSGDSLASDVLSQLLDQYLEERLLAFLAQDEGLLSEASARGSGRRRSVDLLLTRREAAAGEVSEAEIEAWYRDHRDRFARPPRVRLRQILTQDRTVAETALADVRAGANFGAVAERLSEAPTEEGGGIAGGVAGGSMGELSRDDLPPAFAEVILDLEPGEVSDVVEAEYGFHLFQVTEKLPAETLPLEVARGEVERELLQLRADHLLDELVEEARRRYDVSVWERNLPFNYRGIHRADAV